MSKEKKQKTGIPRLLEMAGQRKTLMIVGASLSTVAALFQLAPYLAVYKVMKGRVNYEKSSLYIIPCFHRQAGGT